MIKSWWITSKKLQCPDTIERSTYELSTIGYAQDLGKFQTGKNTIIEGRNVDMKFHHQLFIISSNSI